MRVRLVPLWVALLLLPLAGCLQNGSDDLLLGDPAPLAEDGVTAYLHNLSEPLEGVSVTAGSILEQFRIDAPDGIELDTWIVRPDIEGPVPVVLEITPYYGGGPPVIDTGAGAVFVEDLHFLGAVGDELVQRGYAVGVSSVRGTGNSGGCFSQGGPGEAPDSAAVIEALAAEPWSNGNVGLVGVSYPGTTPQDVWVEAPPALKTIIPISGISDLYKYNFVNGVHIDIQGFGFNSYYWPMTSVAPAGLGLGAGVLDPVSYAASQPGEACTEQVEVQEGGISSTLDGNKDAYWQVRDFHKELRESWDKNPERASVFYVHGLGDWNVKPHMMEEWLPAIQETGVPFKAWLGQWGHNWPQRDDWWNATLVAWFDQFLKEQDTGVLDAPAVQVQDDEGRWRHEAVWPPIEVTPHRYYFSQDALLAEPPVSPASVTYYDYHGGLSEDRPEALDEGPAQVVWRSEPVPANMTLSGMPVFHGTLSADAARTSLVLTLARESNGNVVPINYAAQSLNHVGSLEAGDPDITGKAQQVHLNFFPQDDVVTAGDRIVLIASGNTYGNGGPSLQPVTDGAHITIDLDGAWLELPVDESVVYEMPQPCWPEEGEEAPETVWTCS